MPRPPSRCRFAGVLAVIAATAMLASCATTTQSRVVTVQDFKPHWFFNGNQPEVWLEFTFAVVAENGLPNGRTIRVVDPASFSDDSFEIDGKTLKLPVSEATCPILRTDQARYQISARFEKLLQRDIPGAHWLLMSCTPVAAP